LEEKAKNVPAEQITFQEAPKFLKMRQELQMPWPLDKPIKVKRLGKLDMSWLNKGKRKPETDKQT